MQSGHNDSKLTIQLKNLTSSWSNAGLMLDRLALA